jgi:hypothetical protein
MMGASGGGYVPLESGLASVVVDRRFLGLIPLGAVARVGKSIIAHREDRNISWALNPARLLGVGAVLAVTDAATSTGWAEAALRPLTDRVRSLQDTNP